MNEASLDGLPLSCPIPAEVDGGRITLAFGEGGRLTRRLIRERMLPRFDNDSLRSLGDAAVLEPQGRRIALTTDGYTVTPLFFPGGDIGKLAIFGTVNDLAVSGAVPRWLSLALIIEEGLPWSVLDQVLDSIRAAAHIANVNIVTGDTKVVPRGAVDQLFITTSGIGDVVSEPASGLSTIQPGDVLIVSGPVGCHGSAILCEREQFGFDPSPRSDCAPLTDPLMALFERGLAPRAIRDATRGGVAAVLYEWADSCQQSFLLEESSIPVGLEVRAVCELLGLDPLHLANEGTCVIATKPELVTRTLETLREFEVTQGATVIGQATSRRMVPVVLRRAIGSEVPLDEPSGTPLPRIC